MANLGSSALPRAPRYGVASLAEVFPSAAAAMGVSGDAGGETFKNSVAIPEAAGVCVVVVDGLGAVNLKAALAHAPFLRSIVHGNLAGASYARLDAPVPTTTACSLSTLGTGMPPGVHGMVGYDVLDPEQFSVVDGQDVPGKVVNLLGRWDPKVRPDVWQPIPTVFERVRDSCTVVTVSGAKFQSSGLTKASLRGTQFRAATTLTERVTLATDLFRAEARTLLYLYWEELDHAGHVYGWKSPQWESALADVDAALAQLHKTLPRGTALVLTADHGMVDVAAGQSINYSLQPELMRGVRHTAGEPRFVQLYLDGFHDAELVRAAWAEAFGTKAWIVSRDEAIEAGWYGALVRDQVRPRIGDLLVAAREPIALFDVQRVGTRPLAMIGHHGSLTDAERLVPLITLDRS